jgi:hypothetical protein
MRLNANEYLTFETIYLKRSFKESKRACAYERLAPVTFTR